MAPARGGPWSFLRSLRGSRAEVSAPDEEPQATALYAASWAAVVDVAARRLGNLEEAEAVAQEALLRALAAARHEEIHNFRAFAIRIAINLTLDTQRRRDWRAPREDPEGLVDPEEHLEDVRLLERIREAVDRLDEEHRQVVELRYTEGRSFAEIAEALGMSKNGVFARHERALAILRAQFSPNSPPRKP
jgi:RNA polymerase sigma-70 factor (ECF subfamily)